MSYKIVKSTCRGCHGVCGVLLHIKDNKIIRVAGDPDSPTSQGFICIKGQSAPELLYHADRLKHPIKRTGARGENKWKRITWDEAMDTVSETLLKVKQEYGAETIVGARGTGRPYYVMFHRFLNCLGTPNRLGFAHLCYGPRLTASAMTCGELPVCDYYGFGRTKPDCVLIWGCNLTEVGAADGMCGYQLTRVLNGGAKSIVIDPRKTSLAASADYWLQIRPGTDAALALGMLHTIIKEELYDKEFVDKWTTGFQELKKRVEEYVPEKVAEITWVASNDIRMAARLYAQSKPACLQWGVGIDQGVNNFQTIRALLILSGITGNIDIPGGDVFWVPPENVVVQAPRLNPDIELPDKLRLNSKEKMIGAGKFKLSKTIQSREFIDTVFSEKPYPVKALFIMGSNLLLGHSDTLRMAEALRKIDFIVATDLFMTPTTQLADVVLPAASWMETNDVPDLHMVWCVTARTKVAEIGECRDDKEILFELARRMGMEDCFPWRNNIEYCNWILKDTGMTFDQFKDIGIIQGNMRYRKYEQRGFQTPSKKFEVYCSALKDMGYDPLPYFVEPPESPYSTPDTYQEYPLIIITGARIRPFFHTEGRQIESLRRLNPDPEVEIHPDTASSLGIDNGDWVWIESPRGGRIKQKARLTDSIHPRVVSAQHGWWFPEKEPWEYGFTESNVNMLTHNMACDPQTGSEPWRSFLCRISKV
jgi:anaerobic selenocysteine-containing dehydrogenase